MSRSEGGENMASKNLNETPDHLVRKVKVMTEELLKTNFLPLKKNKNFAVFVVMYSKQMSLILM